MYKRLLYVIIAALTPGTAVFASVGWLMDNVGCTRQFTHDITIDSISGSFSGTFTILPGDDCECPGSTMTLHTAGDLGDGSVNVYDIDGAYTGYINNVYYEHSLECWHAVLSLMDGYGCGMYIYTD